MSRWLFAGIALMMAVGVAAPRAAHAGNGHLLFGVDAGPASMSADPSIPILPTSIDWEANPDSSFPPIIFHKRRCDSGYSVEVFTETPTNGPFNEVLDWGAGVRADGFIPTYHLPWIELELKQGENENRFLQFGPVGSVVLSILSGRNDRNLLHRSGESYSVKRGSMLRTGVGLGMRYVNQMELDGEWDCGASCSTGLGVGIFNVQRGFLNPSDTQVPLKHDPREEALLVFFESRLWIGRVWSNGVGAYLAGTATRFRSDGIFGEYGSSTTLSLGINVTVPPELVLEALSELTN